MKALFQNESPAATQARPFAFHTPDVDIYATKDGYVLEAEMPGVTKDGLEITLEGQELTITGRQTEEAVSGEVLFRERHGADYRRVFELDPAIDTSRVAARLDQGVLFLTLPKSEAVKPRKIAVSE
ncbi:MAG: Hsp20/alpha crystallin family protein [Verrucomicrobiota bacterium]